MDVPVEAQRPFWAGFPSGSAQPVRRVTDCGRRGASPPMAAGAGRTAPPSRDPGVCAGVRLSPYGVVGWRCCAHHANGSGEPPRANGTSPRERSPHASRPGVDLEPSRITVLWPTHGDDADTPVWTAESEPLEPRQPLQRAAQPTGSPTGVTVSRSSVARAIHW